MRFPIVFGILGLLTGCGENSGAPPLVPETGEFVIGVLPDTQIYAARCPEVFEAQTAWLAENADALSLRFVIHLGDLTDDGNGPQWQVASDAMAELDGRVPYSVLPGNHDIGVNGDASTRDGMLDTWFPVDRFTDTLVDSYPAGSSINSFHRFDAGDHTECVMALEFGPRQDVVDWAAGVLAANADCPTTLSTHAYLYDDGERYSDASTQLYHPDSYGIARTEDVYDGEELYQALVAPSSQVRMVLSGHVLGTGVARRIDRRADNTSVVQMLSNFQEQGPCGGDGFLRLIGVSPEGIRVRTYSPTLDVSLEDNEHHFDVPWSE